MKDDAIYEPDKSTPILSPWLQFKHRKNFYSPALIRIRRRNFDPELIRALDWKRHGHAHSIYHLIYFLSGQNRILVNNNMLKVGRGDVVLINPDVFHNVIPQDPSECSYITLMFIYCHENSMLGVSFDELLKGLCGEHITAPTITEDTDRRLKYYFEYLECTALEGADRSSFPVGYALIGLFNELVCMWRTSKKALPPEDVQAVKIYLMENLNQDIQLSDLQDIARLSRSHLLEKFKRTYGLSPIEFLINVRIERAKMYLAHSSKRVKEIAGLCGFHSEYYFCRIFKRTTAKTPGQYRQESIHKD